MEGGSASVNSHLDVQNEKIPMTYEAPLQDMLFVLTEICELDKISNLSGFEDATPDTVEAVLSEAAKFTSGVLSPLNHSGDKAGAKLTGTSN